MKNNKGFTFVELLVVIALLGVVLVLTISQIQRVNINSKIRLCKDKLTLIEESLNLYLTNDNSLFSNSGLCDTNVVDNSCETTIQKIAEHGIIDYDDDKKNIVNPVNRNILNEYRVKIEYDAINDKFSSRVLNHENNDEVDINYNAICGKSSGIGENDSDKSIFEEKEYNFYIKRDDVADLFADRKATMAINKIGNYCKSINFTDKNKYSYVNYEIDGNNVYCNYEKIKIKTYKLNVNKDNNVVLSGYDVNKEYLVGESVTLNVDFLEGYQFDSLACSGTNATSCEYNSGNNTIKVTFNRAEDVTLTIKSKSMLSVGIYYENADNDDFTLIENKYFKDTVEASKYCQNINEKFFSYANDNLNDNNASVKRCNYSRNKLNITFDVSDSNITSVVINPGSTTITGKTTNSSYKYGQIINMKMNYASDYEFSSVTCSNGMTCELQSDGTIKIIALVESATVTPSAKKILPKYKVYYHYQDADDGNGYSSELKSNSVEVDDTISDNTLLPNLCGTVENFNYNNSISYYDKSNNEVNCYYDRKLFNVTFKKGDKYVSGFNLAPSSNSAVTNANITDSSVNKTYRFGQEILTSISGYSSDYEYKSIICSDNTKCNISKNGIGKVVVPANDNLTVTYNSQDVVQTFNIYYHYQDANDGNGYSVLKNYTTNISLPANYDSSDPDSTNRDLINSKKICESESVASHYTYNNNLSYLDRSKKEINCYFDRELVSVTFDKSDSYVTGVTVAPTDNSSVESTSITSTTTYKYRYGQEIFMKINGYVNDYMYKEVSCSNGNLCTIGNDGTTKVVANENITVKPISKPIEIPYKVYNHYQDANDGNGYTAEYIETVGIVLSLGDDTNYDNVCSKKSIDHFTYNKYISYLDRSKKEINCYFDRELVSVTFDKSDSYVTGVTVAPTDNNSVGSTSITSTTTYKYRYGQEVFMKINGYVNDYMYKEVSCSNSNQCTIGNDGTTKVKPTGTLTVKPISKPIELAYKLYNHYQDSNNINGYTILELKDINVVLSIGDSANVTNFCGQEGKTGYDFFNAASYLDRSKKEINCYFNIK